MLKYTLKRIGAMIPVMLIISVVVFLIIYLTPGDPASSMLGMEASADQIERVNESLGLNEPLPQRYLEWMGGVLTGDLGDSYFMHQPVTQAIAEHFGPTLSLAILAQLIALLIALPCGIIAALKHGSRTDAVLRVVALMGVAIPGFLMALMLMWLFAVTLRVLPVAGYAPLSKGWLVHLRYLALPAISLGCVQAALLMRMTRASVIEAMQLDCVKTARAKGVSEVRVVLAHALRNAALPILTSVGYSFGALITGAVVTEAIFNIPGLGQLVTSSIERRDYPVIQGVLLVIALLNSVINLLVDLAYGAFDPRNRVGRILEEPLIIAGVRDADERHERALSALASVGLLPEHYDRYPHDLSGGQRQRLNLARALICEPRLVVCDEPVSALDVSVQAQVLNLLRDLQRTTGVALLFITHDMRVVRHMSDRIGVLYHGRLVEEGAAEDVIAHPSDPYTQALIDAIPSGMIPFGVTRRFVV